MAMTGLLKRLSVMALAVAVVFSGLPMLAYAEGETLVPDSSRPASGVVEECAEEDGLQESGDDSPLKDDAAQGVPGEAMEDANESVSGTLGKGESSDGQTIAALGGGVEESASSVPPLERADALEDGVYSVAVSSAPSLVLDVVSGGRAPGANVTLWSNFESAWQRFRVEYLGNGYYKMTALHSGQALDVVASGTASGTNVTQWTDVGTDNQQWVVEDAGDGSYRIVSKCNGLLLSVDGAAAEGSNVVVASEGAEALQEWRLERADALEDGVYSVAVSSAPSLVLDVVSGGRAPGANVTLWSNFESAWQRFRVEYLGNGYYKMTALHSGQALDVVASGTASGTNVTQWTDVGTDNQQWVVEDAGDGSYRIVSKCNGLLLSVDGAAAEGSNVVVASEGAEALQEWRLESAPPIVDGTYFIQSALDSNYVFDVVAGSVDEGANVTLWHNDDRAWQKFRITYVGEGYYKIIAAHSGQSLDVVASGASSPTNVTQWGYWETDNQLWKAVGHSDGSVSFVSKCNGLYLDIESGVASDGANICVKAASGERSQRFFLSSTSLYEVSCKQYSFSLSQMLTWQRLSPYATYTDEEGLYYLNPANFAEGTDGFYRFADLRGYSGLTADDLNRRIESSNSGLKGTLRGQGQAFVDAARRENINEAFLLSLAILESGWGTSTLASGTYYDGNGFTYTTWDSASQTWKDVRVEYPGYPAGTYYNYFGIGAVDSDAVAGGIRTAVKNGWSSPASAIAGGASWISSGYIYAAEYPQETLYEMRWDLDRSEATRTRGWHQYSTSLTWDVSIAVGQMAACYRIAGYSKPNLSYIVPQYRW